MEHTVHQQHRCGICGFANGDKDIFNYHVLKEHKHDPRFRITCVICGLQYQNYRQYKRHTSKKHKQPNELELAQQRPDVLEADENQRADNLLHQPADMKRSCAKFLLGLTTKNIPTTYVNDITDSITELMQLQREIVCSQIRECHDLDVQDLFPANGFEELGTAWTRTKYYKSHFDLLEPTPLKYSNDSPRPFCYISVLDILKVTLKSPELRNCVDSPIYSPTHIEDCIDGSYVQQSEFFSQGNRLMIAAYYDDIEVVNPIGSKRKKHKLALFYWTLMNIPAAYRSQLKFIHLFAVAYTADMKRYGVGAILKPFIEEMNLLKRDGIQVEAHGEVITYKGSLLFFLGDTPAANMVAGFKEGVGGADKKCRTCYASAQEITQQFSHFDFRTRTLDNHKRHCLLLADNVPERNRRIYSRQYGINCLSILDQVDGFDLCQCMPVDAMHIICEGTLPYAIKGAVSALVQHKVINLVQLNKLLQDFPYQGVDAKNKPSLLERSHFMGLDTGKIGQSAVQTITLGFMLPLVLHDYTDAADLEEYKLFLMMTEIMSVLLAFRFSHAEIGVAAGLIKQYLEDWCAVYGAHTITPKMHYLVHIPYYIEKFGIPRATWCMRMEAKHAYFKSTNIKNFRNLPYSLSNKHQMVFCNDWTDARVHNILTHANTRTKTEEADIAIIPEDIRDVLGTRIWKSQSITVSGYKYCVDDAFHLDNDYYGRIKAIVSNNVYQVGFQLEHMDIVCYNARLMSHEVESRDPIYTTWTLLQDLPHQHPLPMYKPPNSSEQFIQPRFFAQPNYVGVLLQ